MKQVFRKFVLGTLSSLFVLQACQTPNVNTINNKSIINKNEKTFNTKANYCDGVYKLELYDIDDDMYVNVNGLYSFSHPYSRELTTTDISQYIVNGTNNIDFYLSDIGGGHAYGVNVTKDGSSIFSASHLANGWGGEISPGTWSHTFSFNANCPTPTITPTIEPTPPEPTTPPTTPDILPPPTSCSTNNGFSTKSPGAIIELIDLLYKAYKLYVELDKLAKENPEFFDKALAELKEAYNYAYDLVCGDDSKSQKQAENNLRKSMNNAQNSINHPSITSGTLANPTGGVGMTPGGIIYNYDSKLGKQMNKRGWSIEILEQTMDNPKMTIPTTDKRHIPGGETRNDPAVIYFNSTNEYVVRNDITGNVVQVSDRTDPNWIPSFPVP